MSHFEILQDESKGNKSWLDEMDGDLSFDASKVKKEFKSNCDEMDGDLSFDASKVKKEFKSNCDNASFDFGIKQEDMDWPIDQEFEENTNDSEKSLSNDSRKSNRKTTFKRKIPYDVPQPTAAEPAEAEIAPSCSDSKKKKKELETDPVILKRRQKQIDFGKNTIGYDNYIQKVSRKERGQQDPVTPKKNIKYSRRAWDGLIRQWRLRLHNYDP